MKILFSVHMYPPSHNCGAESYIHAMAKYLIKQGHTCRVLLHNPAKYNITRAYDYEGVTVFPLERGKEEMFRWADAVFTHLDFTKWTMAICRIYKKRCFFIAHNTDTYYQFINEERYSQTRVIYNTHAAKAILNYNKPGMVLHPPVDANKIDPSHEPAKMMHFDSKSLINADLKAAVAVKEGPPYITLISLNKNKGGEIFYKIAEAMPHKWFLGVKGAYDVQILKDLPNVVIAENTPDILPLYKKTRILLMPSHYESYGLTCTEAMCNGIPVICTPTFGLKENAGSAGVYVPDREDIDAWVKEISKLDAKKAYIRQSELVRKRAFDILQSEAVEYAELEKFIQW